MTELHIDIETFSSVDIRAAGAYKYVESPDFEILMVAFAYDDNPVQLIEGDSLPPEFIKDLQDSTIKKFAHNAAFERLAFRAYGIDSPIDQWFCTAVHSAYCGLPIHLDGVSKALNFTEDKAKLSTGKALIRYFCCPCKPTKTNGGRVRNLPEHHPEKWEQFKQYCRQDVEAEREIEKRLKDFQPTQFERDLYILDQQINDRGILIDTQMVKSAYKVDGNYSEVLFNRMQEITGLENPNSPTQLKKWISEATGETIDSLAKENVNDLLAEDTLTPDVRELLTLRQQAGKSSIKKYTAMLNCQCSDGRGHGFFQFYGANRTGRWAGRLVQLQNLPRNYLPDLTNAREMVKTGEYRNVELVFGNVSDTLSQLIRTAFIAPKGKIFAVADFSAIEARVTAWLAEETWRLNVFNTHGKIYEASAANMFGVPIESVTKGSDLRQRGKVAELALGYQGGVGALKAMGADKMGLSDKELEDIVQRWRRASPAIVQLWKDLEGCAKQCLRTKQAVESRHRGLVFDYESGYLTIKLPSGRKLFYAEAQLKRKVIKKPNGESWEADSIVYKGMDQVKKVWTRLDTYGGKLTENLVQAIARDLLAVSMIRLKDLFKIVMHVHDEAVCEIIDYKPVTQLETMCEIMSKPVNWAPGLPLAADGYLTEYYKKD